VNPSVDPHRPTYDGGAARSGMITFGAIWAGQLVSAVGSVLTEFGLAVWVLQHTKSVSQFAVANFFLWTPLIAVSPIAGLLADRFDRSRIMLLSNVGSALTMICLSLVVIAGSLQVWIVYLATLLLSSCGALLFPAFAASIPLLVPERQYGRANAMVQFSGSASRVIGPAAAGPLLVGMGLRSLVILDALTFIVAIAPLLSFRIPRTRRGPGRTRLDRLGLSGMLTALQYLRQTSGLSDLVAFLVAINVSVGVYLGLLAPLVVSFASPRVLGLVLTAGGAGRVSGSLLISIWAGPRRSAPLICGLGIVCGAALIVIGAGGTITSVAIGSFCFLFGGAIITTSHMTIWQRTVPSQLLGRVLAIVRTLSWASLPVGFLGAGALVDHVVGPASTADGSLDSFARRMTGAGAGHGIGLVLVVAGLLAITSGAWAWSSPRIRRLEASEGVRTH
jgi:MFS transporter, DHA3 family, macrolide efflux protein